MSRRVQAALPWPCLASAPRRRRRPRPPRAPCVSSPQGRSSSRTRSPSPRTRAPRRPCAPTNTPAAAAAARPPCSPSSPSCARTSAGLLRALAARRRPVHWRASWRLRASARGIAKSGKVPVFRLLGFSMPVSETRLFFFYCAQWGGELISVVFFIL